MKSLKKKSFKQRLCLAYSTLNTTKRKIENKRKTWLPHFQKKKQVCCCPTNGTRASRLTSERIALVLYILTVFAVQPVTYPTTTPTTTTRLSAAVQVSSSCAVAAVAFKPPKKRTEKRRTLFKFNVALLTIIRTFTFLLICCWLTFCIAQKRKKKKREKKHRNKRLASFSAELGCMELDAAAPGNHVVMRTSLMKDLPAFFSSLLLLNYLV